MNKDLKSPIFIARNLLLKFLLRYSNDIDLELKTSESVLNQCFMEGELHAINRILDFIEECSK